MGDFRSGDFQAGLSPSGASSSGAGSERALWREYPLWRERLPWVPLGEFPTPVQRMEGVEGRLAVGGLWVKRDDLSGRVYGGNKVRKLEFLLAQAQQEQAERLLTTGGFGSNHVVATGVYARQLQMALTAIVFPQPITPYVRRNLAACAALKVELLAVPSTVAVPLPLLPLYARARWRKERLQVIAPGGSSVLGVLGYLNAAFELRQQIEEGLLPLPDRIYCPLGSAGTVAGLLLGLRLAGLPTRLIAVRVVDRLISNNLTVQTLLWNTVRFLRRQGISLPGYLSLAALQQSIEHRQFGGAYGAPTPEGEEAIEWAVADDIHLEPTYTAKCFAALLHDARQGLLRQQRVLFWHTYSRSAPPAPPPDDPLSVLPLSLRRLATWS